MKKYLLVMALVVVHATAPANVVQRWNTVRHPAPGSLRVVGSYTAGCIQGAVALPAEGEGFQSMRRQRQRFFGHPMLVRYLQALGKIVATQRWGVLNIGDLGQARGGPTPYGHNSHQNGLDVDIWFWLAPYGRALTATERETIAAPSMLTADRRALDLQHWAPHHTHLLQRAAEFPVVERIFVHPRIKRALCQAFPGAAWLRKLRPWWGHDDHFHVRLQCPDGDAGCLRQEPPPEGTGCDASLDWWLSDEAQQPPKRVGPVEVQLPAECGAILKK
jgi:penicillin-insensitive murein endopeptidase